MNKIKGVIWVSTVLYILISLAIIAILITAIKPTIDSSRDKAIVEQTIVLLNNVDSAIINANTVAGTRLNREFKIERGILIFDSVHNSIIWELEDSSYKYSEPNVAVNVGNIKALTKKVSSKYGISLTLSYDDINLTYGGKEQEKTFQPAKIPYNLFIENKGDNIDIYSV